MDIKCDYDQVPHTLAYRPKSSILAVAEKLGGRLPFLLQLVVEIFFVCRAVHIYNLHEEYVAGTTFVLHNLKRSPPVVGSMAWGSESTADHLFVSSEPRERTFTGAHKVFDLHTKKEAYQLDAQEAGDVLAVDSEGRLFDMVVVLFRLQESFFFPQVLP